MLLYTYKFMIALYSSWIMPFYDHKFAILFFCVFSLKSTLSDGNTAISPFLFVYFGLMSFWQCLYFQASFILCFCKWQMLDFNSVSDHFCLLLGEFNLLIFNNWHTYLPLILLCIYDSFFAVFFPLFLLFGSNSYSFHPPPPHYAIFPFSVLTNTELSTIHYIKTVSSTKTHCFPNQDPISSFSCSPFLPPMWNKACRKLLFSSFPHLYIQYILPSSSFQGCKWEI